MNNESNGATFHFGLETIPQKNSSVQKLLLTGKVFTICMRDLISTDGNKSMTDGKFQPAHLLFLSFSKYPTNQLLGLQVTKKSNKKRKKHGGGIWHPVKISYYSCPGLGTCFEANEILIVMMHSVGWKGD